MEHLQKLGGIAAVTEGLIYIIAFVIYGALIEFPPANPTTSQELEFLSSNQLLLSSMNLFAYVLFGILLTVLTLALYERFKKNAPYLSKITAVFGFLWAGLVIASGMIANIGLDQVLELSIHNQDQAITVWKSISIVVEGLGGGNEIVGGVWVLLLSITALRQGFPKILVYLGFLVGIAGIATLYPIDIFTEIFGLSQIFWFLVLGTHLIRKK